MLLRLILLFTLSPFVALAVLFLAVALALQLAVPSILWLLLTPVMAASEARKELIKWRAAR